MNNDEYDDTAADDNDGDNDDDDNKMKHTNIHIVHRNTINWH